MPDDITLELKPFKNHTALLVTEILVYRKESKLLN